MVISYLIILNLKYINRKREFIMSLSGGKLAGGNPKNKRIEHDFYATNPKAVEMLFEKEKFIGNFLEPCVGQGHIANVIEKFYPKQPIYSMDIVDRGYKNTLIADFLNYDFLGQKFDNIITIIFSLLEYCIHSFSYRTYHLENIC